MSEYSQMSPKNRMISTSIPDTSVYLVSSAGDAQ
jgi:hypothetical protein